MSLVRAFREAGLIGPLDEHFAAMLARRAGVSDVVLEFAWDTDMDFAALDVRERLDRVRLPLGAEPPILLRFDPSLDPIMRIGLHGSDDLAQLRFMAEEDLKRSLERIEGVAAVVVSGGLEEEVQVELDETRLANLGLDADRVLRVRVVAPLEVEADGKRLDLPGFGEGSRPVAEQTDQPAAAFAFTQMLAARPTHSRIETFRPGPISGEMRSTTRSKK